MLVSPPQAQRNKSFWCRFFQKAAAYLKPPQHENFGEGGLDGRAMGGVAGFDHHLEFGVLHLGGREQAVMRDLDDVAAEGADA